MIANEGSDDVSIRLGVGDGTFTTGATVAVGDNPYSSLVLRDLNGDNILDFITSNFTDDNLSIRFGVGDGTFTNGATLVLGNDPEATPLLVDLDGDDVPDIVEATGDGLTVYLANSTLQEVGGGPLSLDEEDLQILTQAQAENAVILVEYALGQIVERQTLVGAQLSRFDFTRSALESTTDQLAEARARLMDIDLAEEVSKLTRLQILQQSQVAVMSQANVSLSSVLLVLQLLEKN